MAGQSVAEGSIILSVDASRLNSQMSKAAAKVKKDGSKIGDSFKSSATEKLGEKFGGGSIIGMGAKAGVIGAAVAAAAFIGAEAYEELIAKSKEYSRELAANERAVTQWADRARQSYDDIKEAAAEFANVAGTAQGIKANEKALEDMRSKLNEVTAAKKAQEGAEKSYDSKWDSGRNFELWMRGRLEKTQQSEAKNTAEKTKLEDELRKKYEEQAKILARLKNPLTNPEARAAVRDFITSQDDAIAALEGRSSEEQQLINLQRKYGFSAAQLGDARAAIERKKLAEVTKETADWTKDLTDELGLYNHGIAKTADEKKLEDLISRGADESQINRIKQLIALKQKEKQEYKALSALERGSAAEISFQNKNKFDVARNKETEAERKLLQESNGLLNRIYIRLASIDEKKAPVI